MAGFGAIAQGIGRAGAEFGQAHDEQIDRALQMMKSKLMISEIKQRMEESATKFKQSQALQPYGTASLPGGETAGITFDQTKGTFGQQTIIPASGTRPEFKTLPEAEAWALSHGDAPFLKQVQDAIKSTQRPTPEHAPTPYMDWRKANPNAPVADWLRLEKQYRGKEGTGGGGGSDEINAYAEDLKTGQITVDKIPSKIRGAVLFNLKKGGVRIPKALNAEEKKGADTITQALPLLDSTLALIEPMKGDNSVASALRSRGY